MKLNTYFPRPPLPSGGSRWYGIQHLASSNTDDFWTDTTALRASTSYWHPQFKSKTLHKIEQWDPTQCFCKIYSFILRDFRVHFPCLFLFFPNFFPRKTTSFPHVSTFPSFSNIISCSLVFSHIFPWFSLVFPASSQHFSKKLHLASAPTRPVRACPPPPRQPVYWFLVISYIKI